MAESFRTIESTLRRAVERTLAAEAAHRKVALAPTGLEDDQAHRAAFGDRPPLALIAFDTPGIQRYVRKVRRPVDIRGGSALVAAFTRPGEDVSVDRLLAQAKIPAEAMVFAGGGGGLLVAAAHQAEPIAELLEEALDAATGGDLRTVVAALPVWPADLSELRAPVPEAVWPASFGTPRRRSRYASALGAVFARLGRERSRAARLAEAIGARAKHQNRCAACAQRMGTETFKPGGETELLCRMCAARREVGARQRRGDDEARTFHDLGVDRIAVVYVDGANVGRAFENLDSMARHRTLSLAVDRALCAGRDAGLAACPALRGADGEKRYQVPILGGDDLVVILPAETAIGFVEALVPAVERAFDLRRDATLRAAFANADAELRDSVASFGVGVGIAIAHYHFPIRFLWDYAYQLMQSAKAAIRGAPDREAARSAVDFLVLRSGTPLSASIERVRGPLLEIPPSSDRPGLRLTCRPYTFPAFERFVQRARALHQAVAPSQLYALRQELRRGFRASRSLWRYQHARAGEADGWHRYRHRLGVDLADVDQLLWRPGGSRRDAEVLATDFLDAVELRSLLDDRQPQRGAA